MCIEIRVLVANKIVDNPQVMKLSPSFNFGSRNWMKCVGHRASQREEKREHDL